MVRSTHLRPKSGGFTHGKKVTVRVTVRVRVRVRVRPKSGEST